MFIHSVYFWLKEDLTAGQKEAFLQGLDSLTTIETVRHAYTGTPAPTDREIIVRDYSYALILAFDDKEGHDSYQTDEIHDRFRENCSPFWNKVVIYDAVTRE